MKDFLATISLLTLAGLSIYLACLRRHVHDAQVTEYDGGDAARAHCICGWTRVHYGDRAKEDAEASKVEHMTTVCQ